jgi:hypothetical protein
MRLDRNAFPEVFMIPVSSIASSALTWRRLRNQRGFEIRHNDEVIGTLKVPSQGSSNFVAETRQGKWIFHRTGFLGASAEILEMETQQAVATFKSSWRMQGLLSFADGDAFHIECKGVWHPVWNAAGKNGEPVLTFHSREEIVESRVVADVSQKKLLLLMMFVLYRILQAEEDTASAAIVAVCS